MTVGTQAAVLAGLDITMFIEFQPPPNSEWGESYLWLPRILKFVYYVTITCAFCSNMMVVAHTTALSVLGAGLALRGPDGSMMTATDGLYEERITVFSIFGWGLACTVSSVVVCVWLVLHWEAAMVSSLVTLYTCRKIHTNYQRILQRFDFDENDTVDFHDIFNGPAAIRVVRKGLFSPPHNNSRNRMKKRTSNKSVDNTNDDDDDYHHHDGGESLLHHYSNGERQQEQRRRQAFDGMTTTATTRAVIMRRQSSQSSKEDHMIQTV